MPAHGMSLVVWREVGLVLSLVMASGCLSVQGLSSPASTTSFGLTDALLDQEHFPGLVVEVGAVEGYHLDRTALMEFQQTLAALTGRTSISYSDLNVLPRQGGNYTAASLHAIHKSTSKVLDTEHLTSGGYAQLHVLVLDGRMARDGEHLVLGTLLVEDGVIAIFPDSYARAHRVADGVRLPAAAEMDRHVLLHELGHVLGLVNRGLPMVWNHEDPLNPGHSANPESVMYHRPPMERDGLVLGPKMGFDQDDLADVAAGRAARA